MAGADGLEGGRVGGKQLSVEAFIASTTPSAKLVGGSIMLVGLLRFGRWLIEFVSRRLDIRDERISAREAKHAEKIDERLREMKGDLDRYREAAMMLVNRMAEVLPGDPALKEVARILSGGAPSLDTLAQQLGALAGTNQGGMQ